MWLLSLPEMFKYFLNCGYEKQSDLEKFDTSIKIMITIFSWSSVLFKYWIFFSLAAKFEFELHFGIEAHWLEIQHIEYSFHWLLNSSSATGRSLSVHFHHLVNSDSASSELLKMMYYFLQFLNLPALNCTFLSPLCTVL